MNSHAIQISDLQFSYRPDRPLLKIPEFRVERGEKVFLFGPSGSGKSTLLELLAGVLVPQAGHVKVLGHDLSQLSMAERDQFRANHLGYIFQMFNLLPYLSVRENIELPLLFNQRCEGPMNSQARSEIIRKLGLESVMGQRPYELSVGQQQRVAVARALIGNPDLILADEPTSALDQDQREIFIELLFELAKQRHVSLLFISHDRSLQHLFDRAVSLTDLNKVSS